MYLDLLKERRSIRNYSGKEVEGEDIQQIIQAALLSPTSRGSRPWRFVLVDDPNLLEDLAAAKEEGSDFVSGAEMAIVVAADPRASDVWIEDCAIAAANMHNIAAGMELGSCWVQIRRRQNKDGKSSEKYVRELLGLPEQLRVACFLAVGHPEENKEPRRLEDLSYERVHYNYYGQDIPE